MNEIVSFGEWMQRRRKLLDLTRNGLARMVGCSPATIYKIERDERRPSVDMAKLLALHLQIPAAEEEAFVQRARGSYLAQFKSPLSMEITGSDDVASENTRSAKADSPHNLPLQTTPFIGRETELARLDDLLADPNVRLITIAGQGGTGKTRLALAVAEQQLHDPAQRKLRFPDGVFFVALASLSQAEHIVPALAEALDLQLREGGQLSPRQQLLNYLSQKRLLLLMDNYEHLLDGVDLLADALEISPSLQVLVTSRERLQLPGEQLYTIEGLARPHVEGQAAVETAAAQLFLQAARRIQHDFELRDSHDLAQLVRICDLVGGMPLALELAASWVDVLSLAEIVAEIQHNLDFLATTMRGIPERHRSMRAIFNGSWQKLEGGEQEIFVQLSVFHGGFTREAAQAVTHTSLRELSQLVTKSLLKYDRTRERYQIHELLRQFGAETLAEDGVKELAVRDRHSAHYCAFLQQRGQELEGPRPQNAAAAIQAEMDNCRATWRWAISKGQLEHLAQALDGLGLFMFYWSGRFQEAALLFQQAIEKVEEFQTAAALQLLIRLLSWQLFFSHTLGQGEQRDRQCQRGLTLLNQPPISQLEQWLPKGRVLLLLGKAATFFDRIKGHQLLKESLALCRLVGDQSGEARALAFLSEVAFTFGNLAEAERLQRESLAIHRALGNQLAIANGYKELAVIMNGVGDRNRLDEAENLIRKSLAIYQELDNRFGLAEALIRSGQIHNLSGRFDKALTVYQENLQLFGERGNQYYIPFLLSFCSQAHLHGGQYEEAHSLSEQALTLGRQIEHGYAIALALRMLGQVALTGADYATAETILQESAGILRTYGQTGLLDELAFGLGLSSLALLGLGKVNQAIQLLSEALTLSQGSRALWASISLLAAGSLLFIDRAQVERAVELYTLASSHPFVASSRWFEEVCGRHVAAAATALPAEVVERARRRGATLDWWGTLEKLQGEM